VKKIVQWVYALSVKIFILQFFTHSTTLCIGLLRGKGAMLKNKKEVIKHSAAIQVENRVGLLERRAWNWLLANAYDELPTAETHSIAVSDLIKALGYASRNHAHLRETLKALTGSVLEWNVIRKDKEVWGATTLLAEVEIEDGVCTYAFGPMLRKRLYNPKMYARISLSLQNQFQSKHALALYELFVDYLHEDNRHGETPFISILDFRKLMGIPEGMYPEFKKLSKWVIKDPLTEINKVTDLTVTVEYKKEGKAVVAVKFRMRRTLQLPKGDSGQGELFLELEELPAVFQDLITAGLSRDDVLDIWQRGVDYVEARDKPPPEVFEFYLREKIDLLMRRQASGKVGSSTGFLLDAIRKNYNNPEFAKEQKAQDRKAKARELKVLEEQKQQTRATHEDAIHMHCTRMIEASPDLLEEAVRALREKISTFWPDYSPEQDPLKEYRERPSLYVPVENFLTEYYPEHFQVLIAAYAAQVAALDAKIAALG
jgi:plasmid replication initiation protein